MWAGSLNRSDVHAAARRKPAVGLVGRLLVALLPPLLMAPAWGQTATGQAAEGATTSAAPSQIEINSLGFPSAAAKWAVVPNVPATTFTVLDARGRIVLKGPLSSPATWPLADATVKLADFSALRKPGTYRLRIDGGPVNEKRGGKNAGKGADKGTDKSTVAGAGSPGPLTSAPFTVGDKVYTPLTAAAIRAFYFNRAGIEVTPQLGGVYARAAGHPDTRILIHASATGPQRKEGDVISSPKGWYDAGDYNKYIVNSGISTYTLLAAYEHFPAFYQGLKVGLPESGNGLPDLLNEALWNLDWMLTMQDPADGGVYHKLTNLRFDGMVMPAEARADRYVVQKTTAATLDFAAVMATASRVLAPFEAQSPGRSQRMRAAALAAWDWAQKNKDVIYRQPADVVTGGYDDTKLDDEFAWAAAELFITTGEQRFLDAMRLGQVAVNVPSWSDVNGLAWVSLAQHQDRLNDADRAIVQHRIRSLTDTLVLRWKQSAWRMPMQAEDFRWGSNSEVLNQALMLIQAARSASSPPEVRRDALAAAQANLDYVLGRNPLGRSQVTGFGLRPPMHPHHRPSEADGIQDPVPGFLVGGANPGQQDKAECPVPYPSTLTALSWLDHLCSYASNEVAINWNAPLVYVAGALEALNGSGAAAVRSQAGQGSGTGHQTSHRAVHETGHETGHPTENTASPTAGKKGTP